MTPERLIEAIHQTLDKAIGQTVPWSIGERDRQKHKTPPHISWRDAPSETAKSKGIGGYPERIATDVARFKVAIWHKGLTVIAGRENVRMLFDNLRVAARNCPEAGRAVRFGAYEVTPDANTTNGHVITTDVTIQLDVLNQFTPTVTLIAAETGGYVDDEKVADGYQSLLP